MAFTLCLGTTIWWAGGLDITKRVTWRFAFEVNKADVAGVEKITRYTFDEMDEAVPKQPNPPNINQNFMDDRVIITIKRSYSTVDGTFTPDDFPGLDVQEIRILNPVFNPTSLEKISADGDYHQTLCLVFTANSKEHVLWALAMLSEMDIVLSTQPSYIYTPF